MKGNLIASNGIDHKQYISIECCMLTHHTKPFSYDNCVFANREPSVQSTLGEKGVV